MAKYPKLKLHVKRQRADIRRRAEEIEQSRLIQAAKKFKLDRENKRLRSNNLGKLRSLSDAKVRPVRFVPSKLYKQLRHIRNKSDQRADIHQKTETGIPFFLTG